MDQAFHLPFNPREFEKLVETDPRSKDGPVGFCALENEHLVGFVGVWDLPTRNAIGDVDHVGGIYGVGTLPHYGRKGICTTLIDRTHEYFREKDYRLSFLSTMSTLLAYGLYRKLGYADVTYFPSAYKTVQYHGTRACAPAHGKDAREELDLDTILRIYNEFSKNRTCLVVRDKEYFETLLKTEGIKSRNCIVGEQGYVMFKRSSKGIQIKEIIAATMIELNKLVKEVESKARNVVYDRAVMNDELLQIYRSRHYTILSRSYGVIMVKPLTEATFRQTYGDRFYVSGLDVGC